MPMQLLDDMRQEKAVYWEPKGFDSFGTPINRSPREIEVRWEEKFVEVKDPETGRVVMSRATVYYDSDDKEIKVGGKLAYGEFADLESHNAKCEETAWEILMTVRIPTIEADQFLRIAYL